MLDAPVRSRAVEGGAVRRMPGAPALRRDLSEDFAEPHGRGDDGGASGGVRIRLRAGVPRTTLGRIGAAALVVAGMAGVAATAWGMRSMLLHERRLVIESSGDVQITGNRHLTRGQLLSVFGEDVDRNILTVPLAERRAELERLPWVEHATVMRLLPNRFRVAISERTPVAFVRQGSRIGLVDSHGVLLDMASDADSGGGEMRYSFPVVSGVVQSDPLSTRAARMKLFERFERELDGGGEPISKELGEVDVSNPEDVKALVPSGKAEVLVHFGDKDFLRRYELFTKNAPGWLAAHPRLASADMRYEHQVVLEMAPGAGPAEDTGKDEVAAGAVKAKPVAKAVAKAQAVAKKGAAEPTHRKERDEWGTQRVAGVKGVAPKPAVAVPVRGHLTTAFDVPANGKAKSSGAVPR